ncbi:hypothetical protein LV779_07355 [Streptomyces thinghirensis]|nr:hypothetical protein [Streptomyces thinghirensis]
MLGCLSIKMESDLLLNVIVFFTGVFVFSAMVLVYAYVTSFYPASVRSTALGSASGIGRIGSIVGPSITGALVAWGSVTRGILLLRRGGGLRLPCRADAAPHGGGRTDGWWNRPPETWRHTYGAAG